MGTFVLDTETQGQRGLLSNGSRAQPHDVFLPKAKGKRHVANADDHLDLQEICLIRTFFQFPQTVQQDRVSRRQVKFANACSVPGRTACHVPHFGTGRRGNRNLQYGRSIGHFFLEHRGNTMEYPMFEARDAPADRTGHKEAQRRPTGRWT